MIEFLKLLHMHTPTHTHTHIFEYPLERKTIVFRECFFLKKFSASPVFHNFHSGVVKKFPQKGFCRFSLNSSEVLKFINGTSQHFLWNTLLECLRLNIPAFVGNFELFFLKHIQWELVYCRDICSRKFKLFFPKI